MHVTSICDARAAAFLTAISFLSLERERERERETSHNTISCINAFTDLYCAQLSLHYAFTAFWCATNDA
jgi:hypothetical protein